MKITGWGRYPEIEATPCFFSNPLQLKDCLQGSEQTIVHGLGRSYGDSSLNSHVILTKQFDKFLDFNEKTGVVTCESGVSIADILDAFLPRGWFPKVTPGTKYVTLGGAVASDVHGKNHHTEGCFSSCVEELKLMLPNGRECLCSHEKNRELFTATCGGMGLTGAITRIKMKLQRIPSSYINQTTIKASCLEEAFDCFEKYHDATYSVAWIDCLSSGKQLGRSLFMMGEHSQDHPLKVQPGPKRTFPVDMPGVFLNKYSVALFNTLYYHRQRVRKKKTTVHLDSFFYPLDAVRNWNRMYGKNGFTQYQFVLPKETGIKGMQHILKKISDFGKGSFLAVLKLFGPENKNLLSFPMQGYTLALDFKITPGLFSFLDELDKTVKDMGGRIYLTKDVRLSPEIFHETYPRLQTFLKVRKKYNLYKMQSLQSKRLGI